MSIAPNIVRYSYNMGEKQLDFDIGTSESDVVTPEDMAAHNYPEWTRLDHEQCACCPLKTETHSHCPAAIRMHEVLETFKDFQSVERVELTVETERRTYLQECDLQSGLNSMLGLLMATSGCPVVGRLRAMATFHMPFCSFGETLFRSVGAYLTKQYFAKQDGEEPDWELEGLKQFYEELEQLNQAFSERIRGIEQSDAISNAMVMFFAASIVVADALEDRLDQYKDYFTGNAVMPPKGG
ncbi:hypothetical protein DDZ13_07265 [Coraliomargarita sinensis]|uniref:Uncharacterized protein n=1 Tax=Coraliomargarita sinensis TaxID=2174842 RepID=A0A317ZJC1_9BACT|nr:hypothetical protein [Coraliomargarita sinensis]PXA04323.1 hypothetical protein DDZ13_07265 [Coraliomargarita sinensis]